MVKLEERVAAVRLNAKYPELALVALQAQKDQLCIIDQRAMRPVLSLGYAQVRLISRRGHRNQFSLATRVESSRVGSS